MTDHLMGDLTDARKRVRLAPMLTLNDHEYAHERGICVDSCPFCEETRRQNMSNSFDKPIDLDVGPVAGCVGRTPGIFDGLDKIPLQIKEPVQPTLERTLNERGPEYGEYTGMAHVAQSIKKVLRQAPSYPRMSDDQRESLDLIATKIARIVCGNPDNPDSWLDIEGYAKLARDRIPQYPAIP